MRKYLFIPILCIYTFPSFSQISEKYQLESANKTVIQWFNNLTPLLQGNVFLSYFDKTYNNKASKLRQIYYTKYVDGLRNGVTIENLLSPNSENYIAKDIKNLLPKTSDLGSIVQSIAKETNQSEVPPRLEGESALDYEKRTMSQ